MTESSNDLLEVLHTTTGSNSAHSPLTVIFLAHSQFVRLRETNIFMLLTVNPLPVSLCLRPFVPVPLFRFIRLS